MLHDNVGCAGFSSIWILYYEETLFSMMYGDELFCGELSRLLYFVSGLYFALV